MSTSPSDILLKEITSLIRCSNGLPASGEQFNYNNTFSQFRQITNEHSRQILQLINRLSSQYGLDGSVWTGPSWVRSAVELGQKLDGLLDCNDRILDRVVRWLDLIRRSRGRPDGRRYDDVAITSGAAAGDEGVANEDDGGGDDGNGDGDVDDDEAAVKNYKRRARAYDSTWSHPPTKPQNHLFPFNAEVVNSRHVPFRPRLTDKPHGFVESFESDKFRSKFDVDGLESYPNPYQLEIERVEFNWQKDDVKRTEDGPNEDGPTIVETVEELKELIEKLRKMDVIAVDVLKHRQHSFLGLSCFVSICCQYGCFMVDGFRLREQMQLLNWVLADSAVVKVMHNAEESLLWLQRDFGCYVLNLFDTASAWSTLVDETNENKDNDHKGVVALKELVGRYCQGVELVDRQFEMADWRVRPLPDDLLHYAGRSIRCLLAVYRGLRLEIASEFGSSGQDLLLKIWEKGRSLGQLRYEKPGYDEDEAERVANRSGFNARQECALKLLWEWRDQMARQEDESVQSTFPDHMLLQVAELLPREPTGILHCCHPTPPLVAAHVGTVHQMINRAKELPATRLRAGVAAGRRRRPSERGFLVGTEGFSLVFNALHDMPNVKGADDNAVENSEATPVVTAGHPMRLEIFERDPANDRLMAALLCHEAHENSVFNVFRMASRGKAEGFSRVKQVLRSVQHCPYEMYDAPSTVLSPGIVTPGSGAPGPAPFSDTLNSGESIPAETGAEPEPDEYVPTVARRPDNQPPEDDSSARLLSFEETLRTLRALNRSLRSKQVEGGRAVPDLTEFDRNLLRGRYHYEILRIHSVKRRIWVDIGDAELIRQQELADQGVRWFPPVEDWVDAPVPSINELLARTNEMVNEKEKTAQVEEKLPMEEGEIEPEVEMDAEAEAETEADLAPSVPLGAEKENLDDESTPKKARIDDLMVAAVGKSDGDPAEGDDEASTKKKLTRKQLRQLEKLRKQKRKASKMERVQRRKERKAKAKGSTNDEKKSSEEPAVDVSGEDADDSAYRDFFTRMFNKAADSSGSGASPKTDGGSGSSTPKASSGRSRSLETKTAEKVSSKESADEPSGSGSKPNFQMDDPFAGAIVRKKSAELTISQWRLGRKGGRHVGTAEPGGGFTIEEPHFVNKSAPSSRGRLRRENALRSLTFSDKSSRLRAGAKKLQRKFAAK